jgi:hypothetical protein
MVWSDAIKEERAGVGFMSTNTHVHTYIHTHAKTYVRACVRACVPWLSSAIPFSIMSPE